MGTHKELIGWAAEVRKGTREVPDQNGGEAKKEEFWQIVLLEVGTGNSISYRCTKDIRDHIVRGLTGGIVLAGGDLPQV